MEKWLAKIALNSVFSKVCTFTCKFCKSVHQLVIWNFFLNGKVCRHKKQFLREFSTTLVQTFDLWFVAFAFSKGVAWPELIIVMQLI